MRQMGALIEGIRFELSNFNQIEMMLGQVRVWSGFLHFCHASFLRN